MDFNMSWEAAMPQLLRLLLKAEIQFRQETSIH